MWQPSASINILKLRDKLNRKIRQFFYDRGYWEVETPYMSQTGVTDIHLANIKAFFRAKEYFLQTSPEYHMKRLLASGSGSIFQITRVFRDDEFGKWHNPEFTLLEWYKLDEDIWFIIKEIELLFQFLGDVPAFQYLSYQQAFIKYCGFDPFNVTHADLFSLAARHGLDNVLEHDEGRDQYFHLFMAMVVEPTLKKNSAPVVIYDFPASQASLAKIKGDCAQRFEIYWQGVELANGFHELTDAKLQVERFRADNSSREALNLPLVAIDERLLGAMEHGLPECSGVALGLDRLYALLLKQEKLADVISFSHERS